MIGDTYWPAGLCRGAICGRAKASCAHMSFFISINGKKRLTDVHQYWISVWCNMQTKCVILSPPRPPVSQLSHKGPGLQVSLESRNRDWCGFITACECVFVCACVCVEGNVSLPLTVGARPAYCTVKTGALNCFRQWALSNECDSNRSSWGHRH